MNIKPQTMIVTLSFISFLTLGQVSAQSSSSVKSLANNTESISNLNTLNKSKATKAKAKADKLAKEKAKLEAEKNKLIAERKPAVAAADKAVAGKKAELAAAESNLKSAEAALKLAKSAKKPDAKAIAAAKAKVDASEKALDVAEEALKKAEKSLRTAKKSLDAAEDDARDNLLAREKQARVEKVKAEKARSISQTMEIEDVNKFFKAKGISFEGDIDWFQNTIFDNGKTAAQYFAEKVSTTNLTTAAELTQLKARDDGYYLCAINANEKTKKVKVEVGKFAQIDIKFNHSPKDKDGRWYRREQIQEKFTRGNVFAGAPFNYHAIYSQFRELNSNPDLSANIELKLPINNKNSRALGAEVVVTESIPLHAILGIDNYGTDASDNWTARGTFQLLNLWKEEHALTINGFSALNGSLYGGAGSYYIPFYIFGRQSALTIHGGYTEVAADEVVELIDVEGLGYFAGIQGSLELLDSYKNSIRMAIGLTFRNSEDGLILNDETGKYNLDETSVDVIPLSVALMYSSRQLDSWLGRTYATLEGVFNLGGSDDDEFAAQRTESKSDYWLLRAQLARIQTIGGLYDKETGWSGRSMIFAKLDAQYSTEALIPGEQMGVGGANSIRGYKEREYLGDSAIAFTLEYRTPLLLGLFSRPPKKHQSSVGDRLQFVVFTDIGQIRRNKALPGEENSELLLGAGFGLRFAWSESFQMKLDYGLPLRETFESSIDDGGMIHVSVQGQF